MKTGIIGSFCLLLIIGLSQCRNEAPEKQVTENNTWEVDTITGLIRDEGMNQVVINCNPCHSSKTITQFRANREGWKKVITWMQKEQNLWDLGDFEEGILDYLEKHYAPEEMNFRRKNLEEPEWYVLKE